MSDIRELEQYRFQKGKSGNPGGRPKTEPVFRARCRKFVDEHVVKAWEAEVLERGEKWMEASRLLAAYGYGVPKDVPQDESDKPSEAELNAAVAEFRRQHGLDS